MSKGLILNTRPISLARQTNEAFKNQGFEVIDFPCIEIVQAENIDECKIILDKIPAQSILIFTSQNSVTYAFKILPNWKIPEPSLVIAVGSKTAKSLEQHTSSNIFVPEIQNSQGVIDLLLGMKKIDSIALICAENGRQKIQNYALDNDIELTQVNVYKRQLPVNKKAVNWSENCSKISILATSISVLDNLKLLLNNNQWKKILNQLVACASSRIEKHAKKLGFASTLNTQSANPKKMAQKLSHFLSSN